MMTSRLRRPMPGTPSAHCLPAVFFGLALSLVAGVAAAETPPAASAAPPQVEVPTPTPAPAQSAVSAGGHPPLATPGPAEVAPAPQAPPPITPPAPAVAPPQAADVGTDDTSIALHPGQEEPEPSWHADTLVGGRGSVDHGGYGSVLVRAGSIHSDPALFVGGRGGWLVAHRVVLGAGGMGQTLRLRAPEAAIAEHPDLRHLEFGYGGVFMGYHVMPERMVHPVVSVLIGGGGISMSNRNFREDDDQTHFTVNGVFVVEPELALELNLLRFMRLQGTLSYRRVVGVDLPGLDNGDFSGLAGGIALLFGHL